jgi:hypothetical protein
VRGKRFNGKNLSATFTAKRRDTIGFRILDFGFWIVKIGNSQQKFKIPDKPN